MIRAPYQVGNRHNSSPTLEVRVFLLEKGKKEHWQKLTNVPIKAARNSF